MKRVCAIFLASLFLFGGCNNTSSDMFAIPELPEMQRALIESVDGVRGGGFDYSEPKSGLNRQPIQLMDLDGDGEDEGIAFLRDISDTNKTYIYIFDKDEKGFSLFDIIEGSEKELYTVSYSDILGKAGYEIIVEWGADNEENHPVTIYNLIDNGTEKILEAEALQYSVSDIDSNGKNEFLSVVRKGDSLYAEVYGSVSDEVCKIASIPLSNEGEELLRIKAGKVSADKNGVFIERACRSGVITDVIIHNGEIFIKALTNGEICASRALSADVNADGIIEIPKETENETDESITNRCYLWRNVSKKGMLQNTAFTYHSFSEGWYVSMPLSWSKSVYAKREQNSPGESEIRFFSREQTGDDSYIEVPLFNIYVLTGSARKSNAEKDGRFIVQTREKMIFAAEIKSERYLAVELNEEFIKSLFKNSESEWISEILFA